MGIAIVCVCVCNFPKFKVKLTIYLEEMRVKERGINVLADVLFYCAFLVLFFQ